jgi:hypothetical protein
LNKPWLVAAQDVLGAQQVKGDGASWFVVVSVRTERRRAELSLLVGSAADAPDAASEVAGRLNTLVKRTRASSPPAPTVPRPPAS